MKPSLLSLSIVALLMAGLSACGEKPAPSSGPTSAAPTADTAVKGGEAARPADTSAPAVATTAMGESKPADVAKADTSAPAAAPAAAPTAEQAPEKAGEVAKTSEMDKDKIKEIAVGAAKGGVAGAKEGGATGAASGAKSGALEAMKK